MGKGKKYQEVMTSVQAADFLRTLANQLEGKESVGEEPLIERLGDLRKFSISFKRDVESDQISVKMKSKYYPYVIEGAKEEIVSETDTRTKPKYTDLKKRMKESFKEVFKSLSTGAFPSEQAVDSFLNGARLMVTYPDRGDEHYEAFSNACAQLQEAFVKRDLAQCQEISKELNRMKTECHSDHK
jgi:XXXCH domain-containing protein